MKKQITFKGTDHSAAVENYINQALANIEEFLTHEREPIFINVVIEPSKVHAHHRVNIHIKTPHYDLVSEKEGSEFYKVIDHAIDVMYQQLREKKREFVDKQKKADSY